MRFYFVNLWISIINIVISVINYLDKKEIHNVFMFLKDEDRRKSKKGIIVT